MVEQTLVSGRDTDRAYPTLHPANTWVTPFIAILVVGCVIVFGHLFALLQEPIQSYLTARTPVDGQGLQMFMQLMSNLSQIALFFWIIRWLAGPDILRWLVAAMPRISIWSWAGIIIGLYALKAGSAIALSALAPPATQSVSETLAPFSEIMKSSVWLSLLLAGIIAAVGEEVIYRGYLSRVLEASRFGFWGGSFIASVIWAVQHFYYPLTGQLCLLVMGMALSAVRHRTGSIYPGMVWHILNNVVALLVMRFYL
jgi:membrane protease YdiL (CAAX protease family)